MTGYVQMTPIPESHFENNNVLDRLIRAVDGEDPAEVKKRWFETEKIAFLEWSGLGEEQWRFTMLTGYPTKFMVLSGPWTKDEEESLPIEATLEEWISERSSDVVYGDTGCTLNGVSFARRAQWKVGNKGFLGAPLSVAEIGVTWKRLLMITAAVLAAVAVLALAYWRF